MHFRVLTPNSIKYIIVFEVRACRSRQGQWLYVGMLAINSSQETRIAIERESRNPDIIPSLELSSWVGD
jgi:hypothetical protein